jgi:hypothetical protein
VLDRIRWNLKLTDLTGCEPGGEPHLENIRLEGAITGLTISNNWFVGGSDVGSGHIFSASTVTSLKLINNFIESPDASFWAQFNGSGLAADGGTMFLYNTWTGTTGLQNGGSNAFLWAGNLGTANAYPGCSGTHTKNVWGTTGTCGTDTFVGGTSLDIDATGHLGASSPAIDAAETPGASDACTDAATVNSLDRESTVRPQGSVCDAGSDER